MLPDGLTPKGFDPQAVNYCLRGIESATLVRTQEYGKKIK